jgi:PHD/YefM family antitoxin component YafN of YafNO toxin-antitoxin module
VENHWKIGEAKQRLSEVIRLAQRRPQRILHRERLVAAIISADELEAFQRWRDRQPPPTLEQSLSELREICARECYELALEPRRDRESGITDEPVSE